MNKFSVAIIGGGASGIAAAIAARRKGASVVICEKMPQLGKKILVSGSGRCNISNEELNESFYNAEAQPLVKSVFKRFGKEAIRDFFGQLGLQLYSESGRVFPITNQASSVLKVLEMELGRLSVPVEFGFEAICIKAKAGGFVLSAKDGKEIGCDSIVIAGGGKSYPALGSDGGSYKFAEGFGHKIIAPVPSAVPITVKDMLCHILQGQKIFARVTPLIDGKVTGEASGDLLFTKYGLSGTCILDISEGISIAMNRNNKKDVVVSVDLVPFMKEDQLKDEIERRVRRAMPGEDLLAGILPNKFCLALKGSLTDLKDKQFTVMGTRGWNEAEFTAGGVDLQKVKEPNLESGLQKGIYFAGEILNVNGRRGGYNLAWAWASGYVAGEGAAHA